MRTYPERPVVGVGGVVVDGDRVLLVKRGHPPLEGEWSIPGGAVELGESLALAVAREVLEETGLQVAVGPLAGVADGVHLDPAGRVIYHFVVVDYLCRVVSGELACGSDACDAAWAQAGDLPQYRLTAAATTIVHKALELAAASSYPKSG